MQDSDFVFPRPWDDLRGQAEEDEQRRSRLEAELLREVADGHALAGESVCAVAACSACDDVLFALDDRRYATVHLSFPSSGPDRRSFPATEVHDSWSDAVAHVIAHEPGWD